MTAHNIAPIVRVTMPDIEIILFCVFIGLCIFLILVDKDWKFDMIRTVAVEGNNLKTVYSCSCLDKLRLPPRAVVNGFFIAHFTTSVLHAIAEHLHGWLGREHRAAHHPVDNPTELCARYRARQRDKVRQDLYRKNRILKGELVRYAHGFGGVLLTLGETIVQRKVTSTIDKEKPIKKYND